MTPATRRALAQEGHGRIAGARPARRRAAARLRHRDAHRAAIERRRRVQRGVACIQSCIDSKRRAPSVGGGSSAPASAGDASTSSRRPGARSWCSSARSGARSCSPFSALPGSNMRDFAAYVRRHLPATGLPADRYDSIVDELASELEARYSRHLERGATDEAAWNAVVAEIPSWAHLRPRPRGRNCRPARRTCTQVDRDSHA